MKLALALIALVAATLPAQADTLIDNVRGQTRDSRGQVMAFTGLLVADDGRVRQLLREGEKRPYARYKTDGRGRVMAPGRVLAAGRVMGAALDEAATAAKSSPTNPVVREAALGRALGQLAADGVTLVHDRGTTLDDWLLYRRFADEGRLTVRIYAIAAGIDVAEKVAPLRPTPWLYQDRLIMRAVAFGDAAAQSSHDARLKNGMSRALVAGHQPVIAARDAAAATEALAIYAELADTYGNGRRARLVNAHDLGPDLDARARALGVLPGNADPVYAAFAEDRVGTLAPGKWADFILLDGVEAGAAAPVAETWVAGRRVWVRPAAR